jgi:hypothetical protein
VPFVSYFSEEKLRLRKKVLAPTVLRGSLPVHGVARALDRCLYQAAPDFEFYADKSTLDDRLKQLVARWMQRRRKESTKPYKVYKENSKKSKRLFCSSICTIGSALNGLRLNALSEDLRNEVMQLVQEIQTLKLERARIGCPSCATSASENVALLPQQPLPPPVRNLFFNTSLVSVVERATIQHEAKTASRKSLGNNEGTQSQSSALWDSLIQQARQHVQEYIEWRDHFSASCTRNRTSSMESAASV